MTFVELVGDLKNHMMLFDAGGQDPAGATTSDDIKMVDTYVASQARQALAKVLKILSRSPLAASLWSLCSTSGAVATSAPSGAVAISTAASPAVDGDIVTVLVSGDTGSSYHYAEPDSAAAIRRRRVLASRLKVPVYNFEIVGPTCYSSGDHVKFVFIPRDLSGKSFDDWLGVWVQEQALAMLYGQKGSDAGIRAAGFYAGLADSTAQFVLRGIIPTQALPPHEGN